MKLVGQDLGSIASTAALAFARSTVSNASAPPLLVSSKPSNSSHADHIEWTCRMPANAFGKWWYNTRSDGPYVCNGSDGELRWAMLNSYRSGGTINVHWKYTNDPHDLECLYDWSYYAEDGKQLIAEISGSITWERDTRSWCALPVYRSGGVKGNQWDWCSCSE